tara:strand:+ start:1234 stop:1578 length:345 start_codon:yes stop_codon:yes gene_type:complete
MQYYICELCSAICYYPKLNNIVTKLVDKIENVIETVTTYSFFNGLIKFKKDVVVEKTSKEEADFEIPVCFDCYTKIPSHINDTQKRREWHNEFLQAKADYNIEHIRLMYNELKN